MVILGRIWIEYDQFILPKKLLMPAFIAIMISMMTAYFFIVKPKNTRRFALWISLAICGIVIALSLVQHVIMQHDFVLYWQHSLIIWAIALIVPNIIGFCYSIIKRQRNVITHAEPIETRSIPSA
jgi:hypothetical protein